MTAPEDVNVDELRRRARRRLVGAIVLALAAAVFVPMLLESEPKPLGEDVAVKIPPVDDGKFVNRLTDKGKSESSKAAATKSEARPEPQKPEGTKSEPMKVEPTRSEAPSEPPKVETTKADSPRAETPKAEPAIVALPAPAKAVAAQPESEPKAPAPAKMAATAAAPPPPATVDAAIPAYAVQLGAFSDDKGANSLVNKLKRAGYAAYVDPLPMSKGTWWRVRVGPYPSRKPRPRRATG